MKDIICTIGAISMVICIPFVMGLNPSQREFWIILASSGIVVFVAGIKRIE